VVRTGAAGFPDMRVWHAGFVGDAKGLEQAFHDPTVPAYAKKGVIERLVSLYGENDPRIDPLYRALLRDSPRSYDLVLEFSEHLEKRREYAKSRDVLETWLGLRVPDSGLERIIVQSRIARTYYLQGDYQAAWRVAAPLIESGQAGAMERAALTLAKLGRKRESEDLFTRVVARYPDSLRVRLSYAGFLWSESRNEDAAQLLRSALGTTSAQDWNEEIATSFADDFAKRSDRDVLDAFAALKTAGVPHGNLRYLVRPFHRGGRDEVAFRMGAGLRDPTLVQAEIYTEAYQSLREWKGDEAAAQWLREQIPPPLRNPASMVFFNLGETDILWNVVEQPEQGANPEWVWLVRAMSTLQTRSLNPARRRALGAYFAKPRDDEVQALARYLIDSGSEDDVWRRARDRRTRAEAAYVVGLKRLCEGDARAASDWFRIVQEIAEERMGEYHWSAGQLWQWRQEGRSLDRLRAGCGAPGANA
jgi:hypothetical protein